MNGQKEKHELQKRHNFIDCTCFKNVAQKMEVKQARVEFWALQKQPNGDVARKRCSENMQQIYRRTPLNTFSQEHLWVAVSDFSPASLLRLNFFTDFVRNFAFKCFRIFTISKMVLFLTNDSGFTSLTIVKKSSTLRGSQIHHCKMLSNFT